MIRDFALSEALALTRVRCDPIGRPVTESVKTGIELDADTEIDIDFSHRVAEIFEGEFRIAASVDDDDEPASPPHHFVEAEIFEMAAVRQIHVRTVIRGQSERFLEQWRGGQFGPSDL